MHDRLMPEMKGMYMIEKKKKYWWEDVADIGTYHFCYNEAGDHDFYIVEVNVRYTYGWTEAERQRRFKGAKFVWGGCTGGWSSSDNILLSDNIEDAKKEFEAWYENYLDGRIEGLEKALAAAKEEYVQFLLYQKEG